MRLLVITSGANPPAADETGGLTSSDFADPAAWSAGLASARHLARPAHVCVTGPGKEFIRRAVAKMRAIAAVDQAYLTPAFGLVREHEALVPCDLGFEDIGGAAAWRERVGFEAAFASLVGPYDLVFFLPSEGLRLVNALPAGGPPIICFVGKNDAKKLEARAAHIVPAGLDDATAHGVKVTEIRGFLLDMLATHIEDNGPAALSAVLRDPGVLASWLRPRRPTAAAAYAFANAPVKAGRATPRVRFYMPECDDRVDPGFDFLNDRPRPGRTSDLDDVFAHDPELYGTPNYDGILISKNQIEERAFKRQFIEEVGVHRYLRVPREFPVMGDCGAFSYVSKEVPPYETDEILDYYEKFGFDLGVSIDHLIIPPAYMRASWRLRRMNGTCLELTKAQTQKLLLARRREVRVMIREEVVTYLPERNLVVAERKRLATAGLDITTYPVALEALAAQGLKPPFNASRLSRLRSYEYMQADLTFDGRIRPFFTRVRELISNRDLAGPAFRPVPRATYDALLRSKVTREVVGETLRVEKVIYFPESDDALEEVTAVDPVAIRRRFLITLWNGRKFLRRHRDGGYRFQPIGAVQGWHGPTFRYAVRAFLRMGYKYLAIGGLAMARSEEILEVLRAIKPELAVEPTPPDLHLFGVARSEQIDAFIALGVTSFDSTGPLRKAWLNPTANFLTKDGPTYAAIRIPDPKTSPKAKSALNPAAGVTVERLTALEQGALKALRAYDRDELALEPTLDALMAYDEVLGDDRNFRELFRKTLVDRPWRACPCAICRQVGIEVLIFRGNDRNRRRGFHNTWVFYQELQRTLKRGAALPAKPPPPSKALPARADHLALELS